MMADSLALTFVSRITEHLAKALIAAYAAGARDAAYEIGTARGVELGPAEKSRLIARAQELLRPTREWNEAFATRIEDEIRSMIEAGAAPAEIRKRLETIIPELIDDPVQIQRPGRQAVSLSADRYAETFARTAAAAIRNEAYLQHYEKMNAADGWTIFTMGDERVCPICAPYHNVIFRLGEGPTLPLHPNCRCRPRAVVLSE
ncbi:MAG: phage head morphogenesis protein [Methanothrix sp.]|nr:phage minor head protein [Methanothrix sp.]MCX8207418.1 phage head morphogenesis protein [Methanothrix sp.]